MPINLLQACTWQASALLDSKTKGHVLEKCATLTLSNADGHTSIATRFLQPNPVLVQAYLLIL